MSKQETASKKTNDNEAEVSQAEINAAILDHLRKMDAVQENIIHRIEEMDGKYSNVLTAKERKAQSNKIAKEQKLKIGEGSDFVTETQLKEQEANLLNQATRSRNTVLYGTIDEVRLIGDTITAFVAEEHDETRAFPIMIPSSELFPYNPSDYIGEKKKHLMDEVLHRVGSIVPFVVLQFDEKASLAGGSRLAAMEILGFQNYIKEKKDGVPEYVPDMKTEARVISVRRDRIRVDIHGAEATIRGEDLGYNDYNRVEQNYEVGDFVLVKIKSIKEYEHASKNHNYKLVDVRVSIKAAQEDPRVKYYDTIREGSYLKGTVIDASTENGVFVDTGRMDILCRYPTVNDNKPLVPGRQVTVCITKKDDDTKRIFGIILR